MLKYFSRTTYKKMMDKQKIMPKHSQGDKRRGKNISVVCQNENEMSIKGWEGSAQAVALLAFILGL